MKSTNFNVLFFSGLNPKRILFFIALLHFIWLISSYAEAEERKYELKLIQSVIYMQLNPIDIDNDGVDELFVKTNKLQCDVKDYKLQKSINSFRIPCDREYIFIPVQTGKIDSLFILLSYNTSDSTVIKKYYPNHKESRWKPFFSLSGVDTDKDGIYQYSVIPFGFINNSIGQKLLLFKMDGGFDEGERGIVALMPETGKVAWKFLTGPTIQNPIIWDIDNDGTEELIFGSYAPKNEVKLGTSSDDSSYVFALNCEGKLIWQTVIGSYFTGAIPSIGDMTGDGKPELVVYKYNSNPDSDGQDPIFLVDIQTGKILKSKILGERYPWPNIENSNYCQDFNGNGKCEYVIAGLDGIIYMLNHNLSKVKWSEQINGLKMIGGIGDLNGDFIPEIVCTTLDDRLIVLNNFLEVVAEYQIPSRYGVLDFIRTGVESLILLGGPRESGLIEYKMLEFGKKEFVEEAIRSNTTKHAIILLTIFSLITIFIFGKWMLGKNIRKSLYSFYENSPQKNNTLVINKKMKIIRCGEEWKNIFGFDGKKAEGMRLDEVFVGKEDSLYYNEIKQIIEKKIKSYAGNVNSEFKIVSDLLPVINLFCIILIDLKANEYIFQVKKWTPVTQRIGHKIKNLLEAEIYNTEESMDLVDEVTAPEIHRQLKERLFRMKNLVQYAVQFLRFAKLEDLNFEKVDINEQVNELVNLLKSSAGKDIKVSQELGDSLPEIFLDTNMFEEAFDNLFMNAIQSIDKSGYIVIKTEFLELFPEDQDNNTIGDKFVDVVVRDNGCGISNENLERILKFSGEFTTKPNGTGFGLLQCKKIMAAHRGDFLIESQVGFGTIITLRFRVIKNPYD